MWLGSSIGNFTREEAGSFLRKVREKMSPHDKLLIGIDLKKENFVLEDAYNDSQGITDEFNINILHRINRELDGDIDTKLFYHQAVYNSTEGRIEMYLISLCDQKIQLNHLGKSFSFKSKERIHTENSYKYSFEEIVKLADTSNLHIEDQFTDNKNWFSVNIFSPV